MLASLVLLAVAAPIDPASLPTPGPSSVLHSQQVRSAAAEVPLRVPDGFRVGLFAEGLVKPREMTQLPSGELLVVETAADRVRQLVDRDADGAVEAHRVWIEGLNRPYGILARDGWVYVANTDSIVRFRIGPDGGAAAKETVIPRLELDGTVLDSRGHSTRDVLFSRDGARMFVSVGSRSNNDGDDPRGRAAILVYEGAREPARLYASGLRNPVSMALRPGTDELWTTVNERDLLGNDLVPDFVTRVREGGFYGWPWYYIGANPDPRWPGARPELAAEVIVPDVLIQAHAAALGLAFYDATRFPERYRGGLFVGLHGSWNRKPLTGYAVAFVPFQNGKPSGPPETFLSGFIKDADSGEVYGRPVAPFVAADGALLVSDDGAGRIWRIAPAPMDE
jgi:glucose/arabinose dehydrogenase